MDADLKVPRHIRSKADMLMSLVKKTRDLEHEIVVWMEEQGIDTQEQKFQDGILVRLENAEFDDTDEFVEDLIRFMRGEIVGYG